MQYLGRSYPLIGELWRHGGGMGGRQLWDLSSRLLWPRVKEKLTVINTAFDTQTYYAVVDWWWNKFRLLQFIMLFFSFWRCPNSRLRIREICFWFSFCLSLFFKGENTELKYHNITLPPRGIAKEIYPCMVKRGTAFDQNIHKIHHYSKQFRDKILSLI